MGNRLIRAKELTVQEQYIALKRYYPNAVMKSDMRSYLTWEETLQSSPLGDEYKVKLSYRVGGHPKVYVIEPATLKLAPNRDRLPHVYSHEEQHLCLYLGCEWTSYKSIAYTIIPWAIEWLYHYELWTIDGDWKGGGTQH